MTDWRGQTADGTFAVQLSAGVLHALDCRCREADSLETGGILIGTYSEDLSLAIVHEATPPPSDSRRGYSWFVRGVRGLRDMLAARWGAKERTHYLGEWHFHPVDHVEPSAVDFAQMLKIGRTKDYNCKEPLLLILGTGLREGRRIFRVFVCPAQRAALELINANATNHQRGESGPPRESPLPTAPEGKGGGG